MLGVCVNALAIIVCSLLGLFCKKIISEKIEKNVMIAQGICVFIIGIMNAIKPVSTTTGIMVLLLSFVIGTAIGTLLKLNDRLEKSGTFIEKLVTKNKENSNGKFAEGLVQSTMIFCVGAMVIYGSLAAGLGDNKTLYIKAVLDGTVALLLTVKYGIGVMFSAIPVFVIQGVIALLSSSVGNYLLSAVEFKQELTAIGGVFVMCVGINLLEIKKIPIADMMPAILGACYFLIF